MIGDCLRKFWLVFDSSSQVLKPQRYDNERSAITAAGRLAEKYPEFEMAIMECTRIIISEKVEPVPTPSHTINHYQTV